MANEERKIRNKEVNLLLAVRRRKENPEGQTRCHRHVMDTEDYDLEVKVLKGMINIYLYMENLFIANRM